MRKTILALSITAAILEWQQKAKQGGANDSRG